MTTTFLLAIDQGTTSTRALVFNRQGEIISSAQQDFAQHYPASGWVEHAPEEIWQTSLSTARAALEAAEARGQGKVQAIGITNQRETIVIWHRDTGEPIANAIVWQDRRTAEFCNHLRAAGHEPLIQARTGLLLDPYFSASKITWLLDNIPHARTLAEAGKLACGTIDCFLIWRLTGGKAYVTDETNAARTSLWNIHTGEWDSDLLALFNIPHSLLPRVLPSSAEFGHTLPEIFGRPLPILAAAGDQQAASFGQGCVRPGMTKATYGTGCFALMHSGTQAITSRHRLLTTRACRTGPEPAFALEGSIFIAGAVAQWLRDALNFVATSPETEALAASIPDTGGVYLVPAFTGLGAPWWDSDARGTLFGLTRQSGRAELVRAGLEAVAYQTCDLMAAFAADGRAPDVLRVDGGMAGNAWLMQFVSDMTGLTLQRPANVETTALGVAGLAGIKLGLWRDEADYIHAVTGGVQTFTPQIQSVTRHNRLKNWHDAVKATQYFARLQSETTKT